MNKLKRKRKLQQRLSHFKSDESLHPYLGRFGFKHWVACACSIEEGDVKFIYFTQHELKWLESRETKTPPAEVFAAYCAEKLSS